MRQTARNVSLSSLLILAMLGQVLLAHAPSPAPQVTTSPNVTFSLPQRFTSTLAYDYDPALIQNHDGTVWVFWETGLFSTPWLEDIHYKVYNWTSWSTEQKAVSGTSQNIAPSVAQLNNGTLYITFSSNRTGNFELYLKRYNPSTGWSADYQLANNPAADVVSSLLAASDGSLWVFWDRQNSTGTSIYSKVYRNGAWSSESAVASDPAPFQDQQPSAYQMSDGTIWLAWSQVQDIHLSKVHVVYKVYNGVSWGSPVQVTNGNPDTHPNVIQDSNGTIWMTYSEELSYACTGGGCFQQDLFYIASMNKGASWSTPVNLTNDAGCSDPNCYDDFQPSMAELRDGRIWTFWASNRDSQNYWDIYYVNSNIQPIHNIAVTSVSGTSVARQGNSAEVDVGLANLGTYAETFQLTVQATNKTTVTVATRSVYLAAGGSFTLTFLWNTAGVPFGRYTLSANVPAVTNEYFTWDNSFSGSKVRVVPIADVNYDGTVNILDAALVAYAYGSTPGSPKWNPYADLNGDGQITILDAALVGFWFGTVT